MSIKSNKVVVLSVVFVFVLVGMASAYAADATYIGNKQCKMCHNKADVGAQWSKWSKQSHAKAFKVLAGTVEGLSEADAKAMDDRVKAAAAKMGVTGPPSEAPECLACHVTAYDVETKAVPAKLKMADGVQCESCHGPASLHKKDAMAVKMKKKTVEEANLAANLATADEKSCLQCHNDKSPTWDPSRYTKADGTKSGFDFKQAWAKVDHSRPAK